MTWPVAARRCSASRPPGEPMAIAFYPAADVSRLEVGQRVDVTVNGVAAGPVRPGGRDRLSTTSPRPPSRSRGCGRSPATSSLLGLVQRLGPLREVRVTLQKADTPSGVAWDGGDGPTSAIAVGVLAVAEITVGERTLLARAFD